MPSPGKYFSFSVITRLLIVIIMLPVFSLAQAQSLREKIGQMIITGFDQYGASMDTTREDIRQRNLGGLILYRRNIVSPSQIRGLTTELQDLAKTPLFMATDQEGGLVSRLNVSNGFSGCYSHYQLGTVFNSEDSTRALAAQMAGWFVNSGINLNLAPVVDVNVDPYSPAIGALNRSFSSDPMTVFHHASWFIEAFNQRQILTSVKHFPGHGSASGDSHAGFTDITWSWSEDELIPYQELIRGGFQDMVMVGHLYHADIDSCHPASLSHAFVTGLLRDQLSFKGVVISDAMFMGAITSLYSFEEAIELAINAGVDILLYETNNLGGMSLVRRFVDTVAEKVQSGAIPESRIEESFSRIQQLKQRQVAAVAAAAVMPASFAIENHPNPFKTRTTITLQVDRTAPVRLTLYNLLGQRVWEQTEVLYTPGRHTFHLEEIHLKPGLYLLTGQSGREIVSRKMMVVK